ncbi:hypothetical protein STENM36S_01740 [Streptomyces tendae]
MGGDETGTQLARDIRDDVEAQRQGRQRDVREPRPESRSAGTYPAEGNRCNCTASTATSTMPTTKAGITEITVTNPVMAGST